MSAPARRAACGLLVHMIDDWCVKYMGGEGKVPVEVRLELERMKDVFANVATIQDGPGIDGLKVGDGISDKERHRFAVRQRLDALGWDLDKLCEEHLRKKGESA